MKYVKLNDGNKMPILGFGVFQIPEKETEKAVEEALRQGYRLIDTAQIYQNEEGVGKAIEKFHLPRKELFITTKIWIWNAGYEKAKKSIEKSLKALKLNYIDLVLVHQPFNDYYGTWRALEEAVKEGKVKSIGVSNFSQTQVEDLAKFSKIKPALNQIELHPFYQREDDVKFFKQKHVQVQSWASLAQGKNEIFQNSTLLKIAKKYKKTVPQVILRWLIEQNIAVIPKSITPSRIKENIDIFDFELKEKEMKKIKKLDLGNTLFFDTTKPETVERLARHTIK